MRWLLVIAALMYCTPAWAQGVGVGVGAAFDGNQQSFEPNPFSRMFWDSNTVSVDAAGSELFGVAPEVECYGGDASDSGWECNVGGTLSFVDDGNSPTYNDGSPLLGANDDSVDFNIGDYFKSSDSTLAEINQDNGGLEVVFRAAGGIRATVW